MVEERLGKGLVLRVIIVCHGYAFGRRLSFHYLCQCDIVTGKLSSD